MYLYKHATDCADGHLCFVSRIKDIEPSKASCNNTLIPILDISMELRSHLIMYRICFNYPAPRSFCPCNSVYLQNWLLPKHIHAYVHWCLSFLQPLSILCHSFKDIDTYTTGFPRGDGQGRTDIFRAIKHCLPGPVNVANCHVFISLH